MPLSSIILKGQEDKSSYKNQEAYLDSLWRKEIIWNLGVAKITGEPIKDLSTIEAPKWAKWNYDLEEYFVSQMKYPAHLLRKNQAGYSVAMFSLDTLGLPRRINILTSIHKDFDKEVIRLIRDLPHCLPCRDKNGKRIECLYTVYVPFLPQRSGRGNETLLCRMGRTSEPSRWQSTCRAELYLQQIKAQFRFIVQTTKTSQRCIFNKH